MQSSKNSGHGHKDKGPPFYTSGEYSYCSCPGATEGARSHPQAESRDCEEACFRAYDPIWPRSGTASPREGSPPRENPPQQGRSAHGSVPSPQPSTVTVDGDMHHRYEQFEPLHAVPEPATTFERQQAAPGPLRSIRLLWAASALVLVLSLLAYALFINDYGTDSDLFAPSLAPRRIPTGPSSAKAFFGEERVKDSRAQWKVPASASPSMAVSTGAVKSSENERIPTRPAPVSEASSGAESTKGGSIVKGFGGGLPHPADRRSQPSEGSRPKSSGVTKGADDPHEAASLAIISRQLQMVDVQRQSYELALELMHARPGAFSGFFPERTTPVASYVKSFEARVVNLEMQKKSLSLRFKPQSREIQLINQEIIGIRDAMKEYIGEQLVFLQKRRDTLHAQKTRLERKLSKSGPIKDLSKLNWWLEERTPGVRHESAHSMLDDGDLLGGRISEETDDLGSTVVSGVKRLVALGKETLGSFPFSSSPGVSMEPSGEKDSRAR